MTMKNNYILLSILFFACSSKPSISEHNLTVMQQLESEHVNGQLSKDEYYTLLTYSIFAQDLLPKKYNGNLGQHDATPIIRKVQRAFPTLSIKTQNHLKQWIKPLPPKPSKPIANP
jgi:hypothetical protein